MSENPRRIILKIKLDLIKYQNLIDRVVYFHENPFRNYICFANVHMAIESYRNERILDAVNSSGFTVSDGVPLIMSLRLIYNVRQERIAGMDFMPDLMAVAERNHESVFFYGSTETTLREIVQKAKSDYPDLTIAGTISPPFRELTEEENMDHIRIINESSAKYIFIGLGCPKQELWMAANHHKINGILLGVGAAFEVYAGLKKMAPQWMRSLGAEWIFRLLQDPKRLYKRYLLTNSSFLFLIFIEFIRIRLLKLNR
jgi:N-acetylglucosaminyldiphosphoundecaprenol N-acetyl-beta-D-mannosaminyltransferase